MSYIGALTPDKMALVGPTYDLAMGFLDVATGDIRMMGYVMAPNTGWQQSTDLQDETHLVQIASPSSSDRYGRYPSVSQGDWSGGERQVVYATANQYYSSQQVDTSKPGHLTCAGNYTSQTTASALVALSGQGKSISVSPGGGGGAFMAFLDSGAEIQKFQATPLSFPATVTGTPTSIITHGLNRGETYFSTLTGGVFQAALLAGDQRYVTISQVETSQLSVLSLAYFAGSLWCVCNARPATVGVTPCEIYQFAPPFPAAGVLVYTCPILESPIDIIGCGVNGLVFGTHTGELYTFNGTDAVLIGVVDEVPLDIETANGVTYILCWGSTATGAMYPVIYELSGSTLSTFDDYTQLDAAFQPGGAGATAHGQLSSDASWLYLSWPGLNTKRYRLTTGAVSDIGNPVAGAASTTGTHYACALGPGGSIAEHDGTANWYILQPAAGASSSDGTIVSSFYDFDTPSTNKRFASVEFIMNNATLNPLAITVSFRLNSLNAAWTALPVAVAPTNDRLVCCFPQGTIGQSVQLQVTLVGALQPDIQLWSVLATLAPVYTVTVACRRDQQGRNPLGQADPQGVTGQELLANIVNAYRLAAGSVTLWVPDPAGTDGVSQVQAILQDYQWTTSNGAPPGLTRDPSNGVPDMEGDVLLTLVTVA